MSTASLAVTKTDLRYYITPSIGQLYLPITITSYYTGAMLPADSDVNNMIDNNMENVILLTQPSSTLTL